MGHWSLSPPARGAAAIYSARGTKAAAQLKATNDQARNLLIGGVLGGSSSSDDLFKATGDMTYALSTQNAAGKIVNRSA